MRLSRLSIRNFRNFEAVDVPLSGNVVFLGENRVGKSNLLFAIRLVLDPTLPDSARQLRLSDFWDGCAATYDDPIEVHLEFTDFAGDPALVALLTDFRTARDPMTVSLSYVFRQKAGMSGGPETSADFDFVVFGGGDETRPVPGRVRRRVAIDVLDALRDAEGQLATWRSSPLRHLLEEAISAVPSADVDAVAAELDKATKALESFPTIKALEDDLRAGILRLSGKAHDIDARLRFAPSDPLRLFRAIAMFIDGGKRGIAEASLGSANVALLALKLAEFAWRRKKNDRNFSLLCIEEPEAHLHPQLQRSVFKKLFGAKDPAQAIIVTSHSPTLAAVTPLRSIVQLRIRDGATEAFSLAELPVSGDELDDLESYLNATRAELLFARGVLFVEGDAEEALVPVFAQSLSRPLDELGITVCNVAGVNFAPYVKLAESLNLPYAVITDWDPLDGLKPPLGRKRTLDLLQVMLAIRGKPAMTSSKRATLETKDHAYFAKQSTKTGVFLNDRTFEVSVANTPALLKPLLDILDEQGFGSTRTRRIAAWRKGTVAVDPTQLLAMIADIGKGRLASRLGKKMVGLTPPGYIADAIEHVADRV
ncbi:endonuclease [Bradyrhizobium sp. CCBAU 65884]|uniref:ATP-dependent nuclease n=1 Tax=Bradyrhizobium sp. CCBAU 65884 TaxID=722477 RepID=UPI002306104E|nr:AAA family ATPase [Bradyrhizobium sp. CCBAU 65884]MDA9474413.1 endonuclease [Bradyrhizobium sp. CCBAU 65884]